MAKKATSRSAPSSSARKPAAATPARTTRTRQVKEAEPKVVSAPPMTSVRKDGVDSAQEQLLTRAEADIAAAIDGLNKQMNAALSTLTELASAHAERGRAVVRTAPLDRATATFQRLVAEVVEEHLNEMLLPLASLRNEMAQRAGADSGDGDDFARRAMETLDHVFTLAGVQAYEARPGDRFDSFIHLAVGETHRQDLPDGVVADPLQAGFRTGRGKVICPARVRINRR